MLELWLLPGGHNLLHHSYFSIAVSAWFEITPGVGENTERNAKQKVTFWVPKWALAAPKTRPACLFGAEAPAIRLT
jgi:hypothetical protein